MLMGAEYACVLCLSLVCCVESECPQKNVVSRARVIQSQRTHFVSRECVEEWDTTNTNSEDDRQRVDLITFSK